MIDRLDWIDWPEALARTTFAQLVGATAEEQLKPFVVKGRIAKLPFYKRWRLVILSSTYHDASGTIAAEDLYALWREGRAPLLLDGSSSPIHTVNEDESISLGPDTAPDYIRFFCSFVVADDGPFFLYEEPPEGAEGDRDALQIARPLTLKGTEPGGKLLFDASMVFGADAFNVVFSVLPDGQIEMVDDDPLEVQVQDSILPKAPTLGIGPLLQGFLSTVLPAAPKPRSRAIGGRKAAGAGKTAAAAKRRGAATPPASLPTGRPAIMLMVEILLDRALRDQVQNRLIGYFNATLPRVKPLDQFAALMRDASPVVVVETNMPFVEETIAEIVNDRLSPARNLPVHGPITPTDGAPLDFRLPSQGPALVLMPLQVYRSVAQVARVSFDIANGDLAALIACPRFEELPESIRQIKDVLLRLPALDPAGFERLFKGVMGHPPPSGWQTGGVEWVKHLLPTDFEHPRRMKLSRAKSFEFIRSQVTDRLDAVNAEGELGLSQLDGLGEARQFAEDLIADIHAAQLGQLPWSQVDRGALLVGAPGVGKTTLAKAIAKECGIRFIQASAASWQAQGESLGPHIQAIRRTFAEARTYAPSILFIDEIDSLGNREAFAGGNNAVYQTEVVNAVLEEMTGLDPKAPVFYIGATNHEAGVDPALRRSGRLDRVIRIPRPNGAALDQIYRFYIDALGPAIQVDPGLDTRAAGRMSVGLTGADVERIVRGAVRRARKAQRPLAQVDLVAEITSKPRGTDGLPTLTAADIERTATHEAGHALALYLSASKGLDIGYVTVVPRDDGTLGFVLPLPDERVHLTRRDYEEKLDAFLGGRAAEELTYGPTEVSSGACSDLQSATELATRMVTQLGLGEVRRFMWSDSLSPADVGVVERTLAASYERTLGKLAADRARLAALAAALADRQEMAGDEVRALLAGPLAAKPASNSPAADGAANGAANGAAEPGATTPTVVATDAGHVADPVAVSDGSGPPDGA